MRRAAALALALLVLAPPARAGGDFVDLAVADGSAWFVGSFGVRQLDARTGATVSAPALAPASYPLSVAVAGGAVWVASVANGFVAGKLTRIDPATGRTRVVLREPPGSVQAVAAGAGGVYALLGVPGGNVVVRLSPAGRVTGRWAIVDAGRIAADSSGCWVSASHRLLHVDRRGRVRVVLDTSLGDVATGGGAVWLPLARSILRIDERTGVVRGIATGRLRLGGFQHDIAVGDGALWTLDTFAPSLQRRSLRTGRVERSVGLPDIPDAVVPTARGVWVGIALSHQALRFDARTLRRTLTVRVD